MSFLRDHQLSFMLFMSGVAAILTLTTMIAGSLSNRRKGILATMSFCTMLLLIFERAAYLYRGDPSELGFFMVRFSNGLVFFLLIFVLHLLTQYLKDLMAEEGKLEKTPLSLRLSDYVFLAGTALLVYSQFTDFYYSFDVNNVYQRARGLAFSYVPPVLIVALQEYTVYRYRDRLSRGLFVTLAISIALPTLASIVQLLSYGVSLTCMALVLVVIIHYIYVLIIMNRNAEKARRQEIEFYQEARRIEATMFEQTAEALVNAIDAKDLYTSGHSVRVAAYSRQIAEACGYSQKASEEVFFSALLHDVGKIGISDAIINKVGRLTPEEFEQIKRHTVLGQQILSSIKQSPALSIGAHYHHERYDGRGYPDGLSGENIPEIARIIAVADAYDAMTSTRSYRDPLPMYKVRQELTAGIGTQFDPRFASTLLSLLNSSSLRTV